MKYMPLDREKDEIRLLSILPRTYSGQQPGCRCDKDASCPHDLVECQILHYSLQGPQLSQTSIDPAYHVEQPALSWNRGYDPSTFERPSTWRYSWGDYVALSYTWGDPNETRDILLNGDRMKVGRNLESTLRVLRDKQPIRIGCKVWIDARSINQQDVGERGQEVKRMHRIYRDAWAVIVWLGSEADESDKAMKLIRVLSHACEVGKDRELGKSLREHPDLMGTGSWRALSQLLRRSYWDRLWILQEVAHGRHRTTILCGQEAITWQQLFSAVYTFGTHNTDIMFSLVDRETREAGISTSGLNRNKIIHLNDEQYVQNGEDEPQFMCMLDLSRKSLSTDSRDKVYGLLGMMKESVVSRIKVDYNAQPTEVFTNFGRALISAGKRPCSLKDSNVDSMKIIALNSLNNVPGTREQCLRGYRTGRI